LSAPFLSIVVPCFNEEPCLHELHARLSAAARGVAGKAYEIVLVNDGSRDGSWEVIRQLAESDPHLVGVNLSRNHGHQLALTAGLDLCAGECILIIDADLQDPPELLPEMISTMERELADVVFGVRRARAGETAFKRATASLFYRLLSRLAETPIPRDAGDFRLLSRRALDAFLSLPEQARFIRGMVAWIGFRQVPIVYDRAERAAGETKYPLSKMIRLAVDAVTGFSIAPLRIASHVGLALFAASLLLLVYIGFAYLTGRTIQGWTSLMLVVVVLGAVQMFVLGMIGEYLGRLFTEVKRRPLYIVSEIAGQVEGRPRLGHVAITEAPSRTPTGDSAGKRRRASRTP
jgi:dolichol-phosphate mannosyltransferase